MPAELRFNERRVRFDGQQQQQRRGEAHVVEGNVQNRSGRSEEHHLDDFGESE
jgi:hypothetical protein